MLGAHGYISGQPNLIIHMCINDRALSYTPNMYPKQHCTGLVVVYGIRFCCLELNVYLVTLSDAVENGIHWLWPLNSFWTYSVHIWRSYLKSLFIMVRISLKWPWRSKSISHILNSVRECPKIYILCKFGFPGSNSCWVIVWTTRIWQELIRLSPKRRWGSRSTDPIFKSGRCGRTILI